MAAEAAEVLNEWRRAERLLRVLPEDAPERSEVEVRVEQLRLLYQHVTGATIPPTELRLASDAPADHAHQGSTRRHLVAIRG